MRTILIYLTVAKLDDLDALLDERCERVDVAGPQWTYPRGFDPVLYVTRSEWGEIDDLSPEEASHLLLALGGSCSVRVCVDVSGRFPGTREVKELAVNVLSAFEGGAKDDFTDHLWTASEIVGEALIEGRPFFDYAKW